ncbi:hypothetical protein [Pontibacter harenae]|uniref:hypothetical protein n=1 Tax=Pontibacter harenae TaxID=2894083 RepID=UPI001E5567ED|nr:hypothetical protein [Pontibacter harenae]MCC9168101.1 hypothetical protein [Pontibacter harenae]
MELIDFVQTEIANTTFIDSGTNYSDSLKEYLFEVRSKLHTLNPENKLYAEILKRLPHDYTTVETGIFNTLKLYHSGNLIDSLSTFNSLAEWLNKYYWDDVQNLDLSEFPNIVNAKPRFYRSRVSSKTTKKDYGAIFHIPFQLREVAAHGRFNLAGMPCLYLGKSIHACWEELNRPQLENFLVAKYMISEIDYKIINLADPPSVNYHNFEFFFFVVVFQACKFLTEKGTNASEDIKGIIDCVSTNTGITFKESREDLFNKLEETPINAYIINDILIQNGGYNYEKLLDLFYFNIEEEIYPYFSENDAYLASMKKAKSMLQTAIAKLVNDIILHPLKSAVSFRVKNYDHPFKPQYILSQFLMQWLFKKNQQEKTLYGLSYLSSRIPDLSKKSVLDLNLYKNYVFPSIPQSSGYCSKLVKSFLISDIVTIDDILKNEIKHSINKDGKIYTYGPRGIPYNETYLYQLEMLLENSNMNDISSLNVDYSSR